MTNIDTYETAYDILLTTKGNMSIKDKIKMIQIQLDTLCLKASASAISDCNHDIKKVLK